MSDLYSFEANETFNFEVNNFMKDDIKLLINNIDTY